MSKIELVQVPLERPEGYVAAIDMLYKMGETEIRGQISHYADSPLRLLMHVLNAKEIDFHALVHGNDPWAISHLTFDDKHAEYVKVALEEIMEYRCAVELGEGLEGIEIIRQLPFEILMKTSDNIMNFGKPANQIYEDRELSSIRWRGFKAIFGHPENGLNPDTTPDNLVIPKEKPELRKHLIYKSARGGYNIKTKGYYDSSLTHYSYVDSNTWD